MSDNNADDNILRTPDEKCFPNSGGLGKLLFSYMKKNGDSIAQIDGITGEKDFYSDYLKRCIRTAITIRSKGITSKDIISICSFNHLDTTVPFLASLFLGIKTTQMDPTLSFEEISQLLINLRPKLIFVSTECIDLVSEFVKTVGIEIEIVVFGETSKYTKFSEFLATSDDEDSFEPVEIEKLQETALILFSSGSTGLPKGVCLHHYGLLCVAYESTLANLTKSCYILFSSISWISQVINVIVAIITDSNRIVVPCFDKNIIWNLLTNYQVDTMYMSPNQAMAWYKLRRPGFIKSLTLKRLIIGGAVISEERLRSINAMVPEAFVFSLWGMTELTGRGTRINSALLSKYNKNILYKTVGQPTAGMTYKIVDLETAEVLGPNKPGELRVKSRFMMNGYFGVDSSDCFDSDGWFKTGDLVYYDENKFFYFIERIKEIIKFRAHHIYPNVIENVIMSYPGVQYAVVVSIPNLEDVEHPGAAVLLTDSAKDKVTSQDIQSYVEENMTDKHILRGGVIIIDQFPEATAGKIRRRILQEMIIEKR